MPTPNENFNNGLYAVSASSPSDIWAVGQSTIHFDGATWTAFPAPGIRGDNTSNLGGVSDISPTDAWAVGTVGIGLGNPGQVIEHWNGTQWNAFPGPQFASGDQPSLKAMTTISANDIWAVGSLLSGSGTILSFLFEHWDGKAWTATTKLSGDAFLLGVSADAPNDIWAVGFAGPENGTSRTLVLRYDGKNWIHYTSPSVGSGANQLNGVAALAPNDVWAVGFRTKIPPPKEAPTETLIIHFDGTGWSVVPSPNIGPKSVFNSNRLEGVTALSTNDVWAFGSWSEANGSGHQHTLVMHWDGTAWTIVPSPNPTTGGFLDDILFAGISTGPGDLLLVGSEDESPHTGTLVIESTSAGTNQ